MLAGHDLLIFWELNDVCTSMDDCFIFKFLLTRHKIVTSCLLLNWATGNLLFCLAVVVDHVFNLRFFFLKTDAFKDKILSYLWQLFNQLFIRVYDHGIRLTLKTPRKPASENVVCLCHLLNILAIFSNLFLHTGKQPKGRSSLIWVHIICRNDF